MENIKEKYLSAGEMLLERTGILLRKEPLLTGDPVR